MLPTLSELKDRIQAHIDYGAMATIARGDNSILVESMDNMTKLIRCADLLIALFDRAQFVMPINWSVLSPADRKLLLQELTKKLKNKSGVLAFF